MRALVTGAGGFLGQHVVDSLLARGHQVRAMLRPAAKISEGQWKGDVEVFRADLRTSRELERAFDDIDVLVHLAAQVTGGEDLQFAASVGGTERLLDAMSRTPCRKLVLASSCSVYNFSAARGILDEDSPLHEIPALYKRGGYTIAKLWQERITRRMAEKQGWDLTVLRPGFIWGRDHADLCALGQQFGKLQLVIGPSTRLPLTHVENCADFFALVASDPRASGQTYNVFDGPGERIWPYLADYLKGTGNSRLRIPVPYALSLSVVRLADATVFRKATKVPGILIPDTFQSWFKPLDFSAKRAREQLGWVPPLDYQECLKRTY